MKEKDEEKPNLLEYKKTHLNSLKPYIAGKSINEIAELYNLPTNSIIKLGSNENPLGSSPLAIEAINSYLNKNQFNFYPDALGQSLAKNIRQKFPEIGQAEIIIGNGMDNVLEGIARLILRKGDKTLIHIPTFEYYEIITRWAEAEPIYYQTKPSENFKINLEEFLALIKPEVKIVFLCNPNNPTGNYLTWTEIEIIIKQAKKMGSFVFLDEAYIEYLGFENSHINKVHKYDNLIIGRTFSKIYGLAALRIGWGVLPTNLINEYRKVQTPFSTNLLGLLAAEKALSDNEFIAKSLDNNKIGLTYLSNNLENLDFKVFDSQANFVAFQVSPKCTAKEFCDYLLPKGIILRNAGLFNGAPDDLIRITIGNSEQNAKLIQSLLI